MKFLWFLRTNSTNQKHSALLKCYLGVAVRLGLINLLCWNIFLIRSQQFREKVGEYQCKQRENTSTNNSNAMDQSSEQLSQSSSIYLIIRSVW